MNKFVSKFLLSLWCLPGLLSATAASAQTTALPKAPESPEYSLLGVGVFGRRTPLKLVPPKVDTVSVGYTRLSYALLINRWVHPVTINALNIISSSGRIRRAAGNRLFSNRHIFSTFGRRNNRTTEGRECDKVTV